MELHLNKLWSILEEINSTNERSRRIYQDLVSKANVFKPLVEDNPYRLFELLGGDVLEAERTNWAFEYTYENYLEYSGEEFDIRKAESWNIEERSIERAHDTGYWYVTGMFSFKIDESSELLFELEFLEGYFDGIIGTPYDKNIGSKCHGIEFY